MFAGKFGLKYTPNLSASFSVDKTNEPGYNECARKTIHKFLCVGCKRNCSFSKGYIFLHRLHQLKCLSLFLSKIDTTAQKINSFFVFSYFFLCKDFFGTWLYKICHHWLFTFYVYKFSLRQTKERKVKKLGALSFMFRVRYPVLFLKFMIWE